MYSFFKTITAELRTLSKDEQGLSMVEYAVAGGLIAAIAVTAFSNLGTAVVAKIAAITAAITG
jgi:pilus assembly protein Flp/PilA